MKIKASTIFAIVLVLLAVYALAVSSTWHRWEAGAVLWFSCGIVVILGIILIVIELRPERKPPPAMQVESQGGKTGGQLRRFWLAVGSIVGLSLVAYMLGFLIAVPAFILFYLRQRGRSWVTTIACAAITTAVLYSFFEIAFKVQLYRGLIWGLISRY